VLGTVLEPSLRANLMVSMNSVQTKPQTWEGRLQGSQVVLQGHHPEMTGKHANRTQHQQGPQIFCSLFCSCGSLP